METTLKGINFKIAGYIDYASLIRALEGSDFKEEVTNTVKEVIKQILGDSMVSSKEAVEIIENTLGYRMVVYRTSDTRYYFLKNE